MYRNKECVSIGTQRLCCVSFFLVFFDFVYDTHLLFQVCRFHSFKRPGLERVLQRCQYIRDTSYVCKWCCLALRFYVLVRFLLPSCSSRCLPTSLISSKPFWSCTHKGVKKCLRESLHSEGYKCPYVSCSNTYHKNTNVLWG